MYHAQHTKPQPKPEVDQASFSVLVLCSTSFSKSSFLFCRRACEPNSDVSYDRACLCLFQLIFHSVQQPLTAFIAIASANLHSSSSQHQKYTQSSVFAVLYIPSLCPFVSSLSLAVWLPFSADSLASSTLAYPVSFLLGHCHFLCACLLLQLLEFLFPLSI